VFIRGLVRESAHWGDFADDFHRAFPADKVHFLDSLGNGVHHARPTPFTVSAMADAVRAEALGRGIHRPYVLGLSLGGMITCDWAQRFPNEISGIVLANTSFGGFSAPLDRFRLSALPVTLAAGRERNLERRERRLLGVTSNRADLHDLIAPRFAGIARARPVSRRNALVQLIAAATFRPAKAPPPMPQLILVGARDRLVEPSCSRVISKTWNAPLREHPTAGHDLSLDAGPWMIELICDWLAAQPGQ
jgi:pimeloyl-ACP methyl ester carboxylesterase